MNEIQIRLGFRSADREQNFWIEKLDFEQNENKI